MWKSNFVDIFILYVPQPILSFMDITVDTLSYDMNLIEEGRIRMVISLDDQVELGTLYFEKAKKTFQRKPIGMDGWACVDAKIQGLFVHGGEHITPKDIVKKCQDLIREAGY
jgi:hypothetical protein